jgi:putative FmdB family regulatory protein
MTAESNVKPMPTYDYQCDACGHSLEVFQGINEPMLKKCPDCGKNQLKRLFGTGAAIVFKGSGFYQTDYRSEGYRKAAEAEKKPAGGESSTGKGESKGGTESAPPAESKKSGGDGGGSKSSRKKK